MNDRIKKYLDEEDPKATGILMQIPPQALSRLLRLPSNMILIEVQVQNDGSHALALLFSDPKPTAEEAHQIKEEYQKKLKKLLGCDWV